MKETTNILEMDKLSPAQFRNLDRSRTLVVIPFAPIEFHGDHLPLGTDIIFARDAFRFVGKRFTAANPDWTFLFLPVIPLGADTVPHGGSLWVDKTIIRDVAEQMVEKLIGYGFRYISLFTGHGGYGQVVALEEVSRKMRAKHKKKNVMVFAPLTYLLQRTASKEFQDLLNSHLPEPLNEEDMRQMTFESHGGRWETSYTMVAAPELMDDTYKTAASHEPAPHPLIGGILDTLAAVLPGSTEDEKKFGVRMLGAAMAWFFGGAKHGYLGHPERASLEFGIAVRECISEFFLDLLNEALLNDKLPKGGDELYIALRLLAR